MTAHPEHVGPVGSVAPPGTRESQFFPKKTPNSRPEQLDHSRDTVVQLPPPRVTLTPPAPAPPPAHEEHAHARQTLKTLETLNPAAKKRLSRPIARCAHFGQLSDSNRRPPRLQRRHPHRLSSFPIENPKSKIQNRLPTPPSRAKPRTLWTLCKIRRKNGPQSVSKPRYTLDRPRHSAPPLAATARRC